MLLKLLIHIIYCERRMTCEEAGCMRAHSHLQMICLDIADIEFFLCRVMNGRFSSVKKLQPKRAVERWRGVAVSSCAKVLKEIQCDSIAAMLGRRRGRAALPASSSAMQRVL